MDKLKLWQTGTALALSATIFYLVYVMTFAFGLDAALDYVNGWVHGEECETGNLEVHASRLIRRP